MSPPAGPPPSPNPTTKAVSEAPKHSPTRFSIRTTATNTGIPPPQPNFSVLETITMTLSPIPNIITIATHPSSSAPASAPTPTPTNKPEAITRTIMTPQEARRLQAAESLKPLSERDIGPGSFVALAMSAAAKNVRAGLVDVGDAGTKKTVVHTERDPPVVNEPKTAVADEALPATNASETTEPEPEPEPAVVGESKPKSAVESVKNNADAPADNNAKKRSSLGDAWMNMSTSTNTNTRISSGGSTGSNKRIPSNASAKSGDGPARGQEKGPLRESTGNKRAVSNGAGNGGASGKPDSKATGGDGQVCDEAKPKPDGEVEFVNKRGQGA